MGNFETACPVPVLYSASVMLQAVQELGYLPVPSVIADTMLPDYARLRSASRICAGEAP